MLLNLLLFTLAATAQAPTPAAIQRQAGLDPDSAIRYVLLSLPGRSVAPSPSAAAAHPPQLVAQCSTTTAGKPKFELLVDLGDSSEPLSFAAPWRPKSGELFPPHLVPVALTLEFLGYTKVKPVRRQFHTLLAPAGWLLYATPGIGSSNMEQIMFYLQYLRALPTLRLSSKSGQTVEFETTAWQQAIRSEPMCHASGL